MSPPSSGFSSRSCCSARSVESLQWRPVPVGTHSYTDSAYALRSLKKPIQSKQSVVGLRIERPVDLNRLNIRMLGIHQHVRLGRHDRTGYAEGQRAP